MRGKHYNFYLFISTLSSSLPNKNCQRYADNVILGKLKLANQNNVHEPRKTTLNNGIIFSKPLKQI